MPVKSQILGFPRIGPKRETKKIVEQYWSGKCTQEELLAEAKAIRAGILKTQKDGGLDFVTVGDYTMYDHVLDTSCMLGAVPERYLDNGVVEKEISLDTMFRMGRGRAPTGKDTTAMAMTKWFDTNYHYMVPEFTDKTTFALSSSKLFDLVQEAIDAGIPAENIKPVILGPVSYLYLGTEKTAGLDKLSLLSKLLPVYSEILSKLEGLGVSWVQVDEPIFGMDVADAWREALKTSFNSLSSTKLNILVATYFVSVASENIDLFVGLPVAGLHLDLIRGPEQVESVVPKIPAEKVLSIGVVNGRNIWKNNITKTLEVVKKCAEGREADKLFVGSSCSLLHSPVDLKSEKKLSEDIKQWLAFAVQKIDEIVLLTKLANSDDSETVKSALAVSDKAASARSTSTIIHNQKVKDRIAAITPEMAERSSPYPQRAVEQAKSLGLPMFPTTTIGSFPQTPEIRKARRSMKSGKISEKEYEGKMEEEMKIMVEAQEKLDLDVLVHGEPERNDMVEYFGELLEGFAFTTFGWVQSYGSRCVKPPIIFGDVWRGSPMTVRWSTYAQSLTKRHMKGMLTGPVTILCWSFVRDDQPRSVTANQIALALRDEVVDLETNGIKVIQIDEPAFREGLPLREAEHKAYLDWAVNAFKLSAAGIKNETQIHTHMCYSDFNILIKPIAEMDADVITIETSRSDMRLLEAFEKFEYPNEIGPGVYDIHSPRVPELAEMVDLLEKAAKKIEPKRLWVNPDCGLKTRGWKEVNEALEKMVTAAKELRKQYAK